MEAKENTDLALRIMLLSLKNGDEKALESLFSIYQDKLYALCYRALKSKDLADDVVIEVFTRIWEKRGEIRTDTSFEAFLITVTKNHLLNFLKKAASEAKLHEQLVLSTQYYYFQEEKDLYQEYLTIAEQTIRQMPPQRQRVFKLRLDEGLSYDEIGIKLGLSRNTVKTHLSEASKQLRSHFRVHHNTSLYLLASAYLDLLLTFK